MAGQSLQRGPAWVSPDLGCVIIGTSEQEIPMDSYKREEELLQELKYSKQCKKIKEPKSAGCVLSRG